MRATYLVSKVELQVHERECFVIIKVQTDGLKAASRLLCFQLKEVSGKSKAERTLFSPRSRWFQHN